MKSVLIVEDEIFIAMELERILEDGGYRVAAIAADQSEALLVANDIDLAFIDLNLRDGATGTKIAKQLAANHGVRVVYVTANPGQIGESAPFAVACIHKPFTAQAILAAAALAAASSGPSVLP